MGQSLGEGYDVRTRGNKGGNGAGFGSLWYIISTGAGKHSGGNAMGQDGRSGLRSTVMKKKKNLPGKRGAWAQALRPFSAEC